MRSTRIQYVLVVAALLLLGVAPISAAAPSAHPTVPPDGVAARFDIAFEFEQARAIADAGDVGGPPSTAQPAATTVILVRHAEKAADGDPEFDPASPADPPLTATGRARADALVRTLGEADVTAIYSSEFARTRQTVAPLADILGMQITTHPAGDTAGLVQRILADHRGGTVVVVGHSNTVPAIIEAFGAGTVDAIEEAWEHDNLYFVVVEPSGGARVTTLKYGAPSRQ